MTNMLDFEAFRQTPLNTAPYDYLVVENFIQPDCFGGISADFPVIDGTGSYPPDTLDIQGQFAGLRRGFRKITVKHLPLLSRLIFKA